MPLGLRHRFSSRLYTPSFETSGGRPRSFCRQYLEIVGSADSSAKQEHAII